MNPVIIGNATLYLGDALELRESFGNVDALIGDPPYGQADPRLLELGLNCSWHSKKRLFGASVNGYKWK